MITPETIGVLLTSFLLCVTVPLLSGVLVSLARFYLLPLLNILSISPERLFNVCVSGREKTTLD